MLDAAISVGEFSSLVREVEEALEDGRLWQVWITGVSPLDYNAWKAELAEQARIRQVIAATDTDDVIADAMAVAKSAMGEVTEA
ncbi:MAG: hypothetical protein RSN88_10815 [Gordonibacter sp.]|uniref:hypothetical protein n=1 Tax=Gordonibacter sp. TaxID=1968902 RepID=UPI002FC9BB2F